MKATGEKAFETLIEEHLLANGYLQRKPEEYSDLRALISADLTGYVAETQPTAWDKLRKIHGAVLEERFLDAFHKATETDGVLHVLRHGFSFYGQKLRLVTFAPAFGLNPEVEQMYRANRVAVMRQVHFDPKEKDRSIDVVLFVNGVPVVTAELKNALTDQNAEHAKHQYRTRRDPEAPLFAFKRRALVHFAVGSDEVWMTTRLARDATHFLPFNRGHGTGKGNPPVEGKHRTSYLWEETWQRDRLLDLLARFLHLEVIDEKGADGKVRRKESMIFPRYHQLDCVRKLVVSARDRGAGTNYLVQHSAGSGKSNTIAWLAHQLASLHDAQDRKVYDSVVVITDRVVLDQQLQATIFQFDHKQGVVLKIEEDSAQLAKALETGVPIVITTIHKFGFVADKIESLPDRRYAVIVDEAHSSQSGDMAANLKEILSASSIAKKLEQEDTDDLTAPEQAALRAAIARGPQPNLSFFGFTATPKFKTLEMFGHKGPDGKPAAFHLYSMRQAIEEGFILDVLLGYTTYKRYFKLVKAVSEDPELDKRKAARALGRFVSLHPVNIAQKTEIIVEHFRACVRPLINGRAKAMVVTESRLHAVRYKQQFDKYLAEKGYTDVGVLVAFSGEVRDPDLPDEKYTEPSMNRGIREKELPEKFTGEQFNVLIVANKYQTGFDQPLLVAMYVDKRLSGIQAVQTLSRLNRTCPGKPNPFILDFVNEREEIRKSFQLYYTATTVEESVDPQRLYELQSALDAAQIYHFSEVEAFAAAFFKPAKDQRPEDNAKMNAALDPAVDRFKAADADTADDFRDKLQAFCNLYGFLAQVVPFSDLELEKRFAFGRMLQKKLPLKGEKEPPLDLSEDVALKYYRLQKTAEGALRLSAESTQVVCGPVETGTGRVQDVREPLSHLIELINERFGTDFDAQDLIDGVTKQLVDDEKIRQAAQANTKENFRYVLEPALDAALVDRHDKHRVFIDSLFSNPEMLRLFRGFMLDGVYERLSDLRGTG